MKNQICCWKQIKRTFDGGFTFMRQIYYACITQKKKKINLKSYLFLMNFKVCTFITKKA